MDLMFIAIGILLFLVVGGIVFFAVINAIFGTPRVPGIPSDICKNCGYLGKMNIGKDGSVGWMLFLFLLAFIPGIIYALWRSSQTYKICPKCQSREIVPVSSPIGQELVVKYPSKLPEAVVAK